AGVRRPGEGARPAAVIPAAVTPAVTQEAVGAATASPRFWATPAAEAAEPPWRRRLPTEGRPLGEVSAATRPATAAPVRSRARPDPGPSAAAPAPRAAARHPRAPSWAAGARLPRPAAHRW